MATLEDLQEPLDFYVYHLENRQDKAVAQTGLINHKVTDKRYAASTPGYTKLPCSMYFYYVRINSDGKLLVSHYFYPEGNPDDPKNPKDPNDWPGIKYDPDDPTDLKDLIRRLALNARPLTSDRPVRDLEPIGGNFKDMLWKRKSYIAFFLDEVNWKLHKLDDDNPSIIFITDPKDGLTGLENHTFFDALELSITMPIKNPGRGEPTVDERSAFVFINHMKADDNGRDLDEGDDPQKFQFKIIFKVSYADGTGDGMTVIFDPDGTNDGPPIGPP